MRELPLLHGRADRLDMVGKPCQETNAPLPSSQRGFAIERCLTPTRRLGPARPNEMAPSICDVASLRRASYLLTSPSSAR